MGKSKERIDIGDAVDEDGFVHLQADREREFRLKNRQHALDALTSALSAFYAKFMVVLGLAFPVTDVLTPNTPNKFYQAFYFYLYIGSIAFVAFMYIDRLRFRRMYAASLNEGKYLKPKHLYFVMNCHHCLSFPK